ncbi:flavin reductase family protein [Sciscionella marina]|uniref:flavin reductase family protein n=1 Tax=Sciscionella marina TaxID=508770 RepID=UPI00039D9123|nr:flavin reductase family protein [Sciscionella marina]
MAHGIETGPGTELLNPVPADDDLRHAFAAYPSGIIALCAEREGTPMGMAASSFTSVSMEPPLVSVCVQLTSRTWPRLREAGHLGLSVLAQGHEAACRALSDKDGNRFAGVDRRTSGTGAIFVSGATLWLECRVTDELPAGDHLIAVLRIDRLHVDHTAEPLVFHQSCFRGLMLP